jgi:hypothetical protein
MNDHKRVPLVLMFSRTHASTSYITVTGTFSCSRVCERKMCSERQYVLLTALGEAKLSSLFLRLLNGLFYQPQRMMNDDAPVPHMT